jgi:hypothetical protein
MTTLLFFFGVLAIEDLELLQLDVKTIFLLLWMTSSGGTKHNAL